MEVVTLCGSTKFREKFEEVAKSETLNGNVVLMPNVWETHSDIDLDGEGADTTEASPITKIEKEMLDAIHLLKIDMCNRIVVVNPDGYIGESTRKEIIYAFIRNKPIVAVVKIDLEEILPIRQKRIQSPTTSIN